MRAQRVAAILVETVTFAPLQANIGVAVDKFCHAFKTAEEHGDIGGQVDQHLTAGTRFGIVRQLYRRWIVLAILVNTVRYKAVLLEGP